MIQELSTKENYKRSDRGAVSVASAGGGAGGGGNYDLVALVRAVGIILIVAIDYFAPLPVLPVEVLCIVVVLKILLAAFLTDAAIKGLTNMRQNR